MDEEILSVIPARKGSKGIPRKNVRDLGGKPLIGHAIETSHQASLIDEVAITTDSREIAQIGRHFDADAVIDRPAHLATDDVPLAPVVKHAFESVDGDFTYVLCFQPTTPLIEPGTIDDGIQYVLDRTSDSGVFVADSTHHYWKETDSGYEPVSSDRKNRQQMDPIYAEIGVFLSHNAVIKDSRRIGDDPTFYTVSSREGIDIDTYTDWITAESYLDRKQLVYRVTGNEENGTGHIFRGITIADELFKHDILFAVSPNDDIAIEKLEENNYDYRVFDDNDSFLAYVGDASPFVVLNDILDTAGDYVRSLQETGARVVNFEDLGEGANHADAVINALYEYSNPPENHYYGFQYFCLRGEFRFSKQKSAIESVDRIMISFGGADQNNLTARTLEAISSIDDSLHLDVVLGLGYGDRGSLESIVSKIPDRHTVEINREVQSMAQHMGAADLLITSNGRTLYEAASLNLPVISLAQNAREQKHPYAHVSQGILSLGLAEYVLEEKILDAVIEYINEPTKRETMRQALSDHDIDNGIDRIKQIIFNEKYADS
ncbi:cytidylyltransferase domain-containing protein [Halorientalis regularis]|uniref:CMP-N-acetylneuraminic acid synthetase n=1 Tax=Halorientalis regularis TaxID=660518 RepID=A0A1G7HFX4_9EURY|nr:glycosyltransferase [Halorientalis regularis]SDE99370.1 CMP-N-acetylneuraminic acid synthetase [Halorientalis regularis]